MIPKIPRFATIRSVLSAWVLMGQHTSFVKDTSTRISGKSDGDHAFGQFAHQLSRHVFRNAYSEDRLLCEHTNFKLFTSFLDPVSRDTWRREVPLGTRRGLALVSAVSRQSEIESPTLRYCAICCNEDLQTYGIGHWRVFHQWPIARHCVVHGDRLNTHCDSCGAAISRGVREQVAGGPCAVCGGRTFSARNGTEPPGYWGLLQLLYGILQQGRDLSWDMDKVFCLAVLAAESRGSDLLRMTLDAWNVLSIDELGLHLGFSSPQTCRRLGAKYDRPPPWQVIAAMIATSGVSLTGHS